MISASPLSFCINTPPLSALQRINILEVDVVVRPANWEIVTTDKYPRLSGHYSGNKHLIYNVEHNCSSIVDFTILNYAIVSLCTLSKSRGQGGQRLFLKLKSASESVLKNVKGEFVLVRCIVSSVMVSYLF